MRLLTRALLAVVVAALAAACQPAPTDVPVPTLAVLPSVTPSPTETPTAAATATLDPNIPTATLTPLPTLTPSATVTPFPTFTPQPSPTTDVTRAAAASQTAAAIEAPRIVTLTASPTRAGGAGSADDETTNDDDGDAASPVPLVAADVVITQGQFQEALDAALAGQTAIREARANFTPDGIRILLTASGGDALVTGTVLIVVEPADRYVTIRLGEIVLDAEDVPEDYLRVASGDLLVMIIDVLTTLLDERVGEENDLERIVLTDDEMQITLLVPDA